MILRQLNPGPCRTYLVASQSTREAALVDPVFELVPNYVKLLAEERLTLVYLVDTHSHADHLSGAPLLLERTGAEYVMESRSPVVSATKRVSDGSTLPLGDVTLEFIETPGHTKDSVSLKLEGALLTGDWLFIGGAGRMDLPGGDPGAHWDSLQRVIPRLPDDTVIYPAHDYRQKTSSRLDVERRENPNLEPRSRVEYVFWLHAMDQPTPEWMLKMLELNHRGVTDPRIDLTFRPEEIPACMSSPVASSITMTIPTLSVDDLKSMTEGGADPFVLDVRQPDEYVGPLGHIPGAVLIPLGELGGRLAEVEAYRGETVVTVCRSGARSANAAAILQKAGFQKVYNLAGGTQAWFEHGFPVER